MSMETKLKFKVGDKVRVKSLEWYNSKKNIVGSIMEGKIFTEDMIEYCSKILTIEAVCGDYYTVEGNSKYWQDWMLEDEVVTEIETKEMTQEEIFGFLKRTKILCTSKEEAAQVQEKLLQLGLEWVSGLKQVRNDRYLFFISDKHKIQSSSDMGYWINDINRRIEPNDVLTIKLKEEEKPKFDPKSLQAFDKVLVRDKEGDRWRCNLFCHIKEELGFKYFCIYDNWKYCIPYNEDTKHLHCTTEEAPEFYRI